MARTDAPGSPPRGRLLAGCGLVVLAALLWSGVRQGDSWGYQIIRPPVKGIFDDPINVAWLRGTIGYQRAGGDFHGLTPVGGFTLCLYPFNIVNHPSLTPCRFGLIW